MNNPLRFLGICVPASARQTFDRDLPNQMVQGALQVLYMALAIVVVKQCLAGGDWEVAAIQSSMMVGFLASLFYTEFGKAYNPVMLVVVPQFFGRLILLLVIMVAQSTFFTLIICCVSFLHSLSLPLLGVIYQRNYPVGNRGRLVSFIRQWHMLMALIVAWSVGWFLEMEQTAFRWIYPIAGVVGIIGILWFAGVQCPIQKPREQWRLRNIPQILLQDRNFLLFMLFQFMLGFAALLGHLMLQLYVNKETHLNCSPQQAAVILGVIPPLAMLLTVRIWGRVFDSINIVWFRAIASTIMALGYGIYAIDDSLVIVGCGAFLWGMGRCGGQLAWTLGVLAFAPQERAGLYLGVHTFLTGFRGVIAPFVGVWVLQFGHPRLCFAIVAMIVMLSALFTLLFVRDPNNS